MNKLVSTLLFGLITTFTIGQNYWQQAISYDIEVDFDVNTHQFNGSQQMVYTNNSPDTLNKLFIHLYFNAFQPGSMMDVRSRTIADPDKRIGDRIASLKPDEIGYHNIQSLTINGAEHSYEIAGTVMEITLDKPIAPGTETELSLAYISQVPVQIRRSGRYNKEGVAYTMTQWYPKMAEYDDEGWHANPYIAREYHGVWGDFKVTVAMDSNFVIGGTGVIKENGISGSKKNWVMTAENVHDFAWAADDEFIVEHVEATDGPTIHFYRKDNEKTSFWPSIYSDVAKLFEVMNDQFGKYPYESFSVIQGGDGGMEYPMCTMIRGEGKPAGTLELIAHEAFHNWYYGVLATNESKYPWMDEGFTSYAESMVVDSVTGANAQNPLERSYAIMRQYGPNQAHVPLTYHADFFPTNQQYSISSYVKGSVFLHQLNYIVGEQGFRNGMLAYFDTWKFKHPTPRDFKRVMEKESGLELDWYFEQWIGTANNIDYAIDTVSAVNKETLITLERKGLMPMPIDIRVTFEDGSRVDYHIPMEIMRGHKLTKATVIADWQWVNPTYSFTIPVKLKRIASVQIDPTTRLADIDLTNNRWPKSSE